MEEKLLLNVLLPATGRTYEFRLPLDMSVETGTRLMAQILASRMPSRYVASEEVDLMHREGPHAGELVAPWETFRSLVLQEALLMGSSVALM